MKIDSLRFISGILVLLVLAASGFCEENQNLALHALVRTNGSHDRYHYAQYAVDGNRQERDLAWWSEKGYPCWFQVDLGETKKIDTIHLFPWWGDGRHYQYYIEISNDEKNWRRVVDERENTVPSDEKGRVYRFESEEARFIRATFTYNSANKSIHLVEIEVYGRAPKRSTALEDNRAGQQELEKRKEGTKRTIPSSSDKIYYWVEAEATDGNNPGGYWWVQNILDASGGKAISYGGGYRCGSWYGIEIPQEGTYNIWLRHGRTKRLAFERTGCHFEVQVDEEKVGEVKSPDTPKSSHLHKFGKTAAWSLAGKVGIEEDEYQLMVIWRGEGASRELDAILLTTDLDYKPEGIEKPKGTIIKDRGICKGNSERLTFQ